MTNHNRIPTKSPWWHMDDETFEAIVGSISICVVVSVVFVLVVIV